MQLWDVPLSSGSLWPHLCSLQLCFTLCNQFLWTPLPDSVRYFPCQRLFSWWAQGVTLQNAQRWICLVLRGVFMRFCLFVCFRGTNDNKWNKPKHDQVSSCAAGLCAELSALRVLQLYAAAWSSSFAEPVVETEPKCQWVWPLHVGQEVTTDKLAAGGPVRREELSSSQLLLRRVGRKRQMMVKTTVSGARGSACPLFWTAVIEIFTLCPQHFPKGIQMWKFLTWWCCQTEAGAQLRIAECFCGGRGHSLIYSNLKQNHVLCSTYP